MSALAATVAPKAKAVSYLFRNSSTPPANDLFTNAQTLTRGTPAHGRLVGSTTSVNDFYAYAVFLGSATYEPTYRTDYPYSVWYHVANPGGSNNFVIGLTLDGHGICMVHSGPPDATLTTLTWQDSVGAYYDFQVGITQYVEVTVPVGQDLWILVAQYKTENQGSDVNGLLGVGVGGGLADFDILVWEGALLHPNSITAHATVSGRLNWRALNADVRGSARVTAHILGPLVPPPNDNFADATLITVDLTYHDTLFDSTVEPHDFYVIVGGDESLAATYAVFYPHTVWYRFVAAADDIATFTMDTFGQQIIAVLYQATVEPATLENISVVTAFQSTLTYPVSVGQVFYVQVLESAAGDPFDLSVAVGHPPPDLDAGLVAPANVAGVLGLAMPLAATVQASVTVRAAPIYNGYFGVLLAPATAHGYVHVDDNRRVTAWTGDPPLTGNYPASDAPLPLAAGITIEEFIGSAGDDQQQVEEWVNLLASDVHSADQLGYREHPLGPAAGLVYGVERWLRVRVQAPFDILASLRFWAEGLELAPGWSINYGVATAYTAPASGASAIATASLPTADPGVDAPNLIDAPLIGTVDRYSKWLVLQAVCDPTLGNRQPIGYASESWQPVPLQLRFAWLEAS